MHNLVSTLTRGALLAHALCLGLALGRADAQCASIPNCQLVWSDEFSGTAVDPAKWEFQTGDGSLYGIPGWGNNELQWYQAANTSVSGGLLTIEARQQSVGGKSYTSSRLRSLGRADFLYGRFEMRARLPLGKGLWPAFWMLPSDNTIYGTWAASGEIDVMETIGSQTVYGTIHYGGSFPANVSSSSTTTPSVGSVADFHEYAVEWEPGAIRWYLDDVLYGTKTSWYSSGGPFPAPFDIEFHLLLNLAVGGNFPGSPDGSTVFPSRYVVDYVRVYQQGAPDPAKAARCESSKTRAAGKYAACTSATYAKAARRAVAADSGRLAACAAKLGHSFQGAEDSAAGSCVDSAEADALQDALDDCVQAVVASLGGVPGAGGATASCQSGKIKEAGKYFDCRLRATSKAAARGIPPDFSRCPSKLSSKWSKLEGSSSRPCSTSGDLSSVQAALGLCHASVAASLAAPDCGNGVVNAGEECDDGNIASGDGCSAQCQLQPEYEQDFEGLAVGGSGALSGDGWLVYGNVYHGTTGIRLYGYGTDPAPNGGNAFSALVSGQGGAAQGGQQLSVYSDYNNGDHGNGHRIEALVFRERTLTANDVGKTFELRFDAKRGNLTGSATAEAFIKVLDPTAGYATTRFMAESTTAVGGSWESFSVSLDIDAGLAGQIVQYGFANRASNYEGSGVYYDNLMWLRRPTTP